MSRNTITGDMRDYPVQQQPCRTCPFEGEEALQLSPESYTGYIQNLMGQGQHICHSSNKTRICRGGRNIQLRWLCGTGQLAEPTDKAFDEAVNNAMNKKKR